MHQTGLEPPPKDWQYDVPHQMLKPIIQENRNGYNDIINFYTPGKYSHTLGEYVQVNGEVENHKKSHEYSDSEDSESSDECDSNDSDCEDDSNQNRDKSSHAQTEKDTTQTIEIKIITSNQPQAAPQIVIEQPHIKKDVENLSS